MGTDKNAAGGKSGSSWIVKAGWIAALVVAVGVALALKGKGPGGDEGEAAAPASAGAGGAAPLIYTLLDLGSVDCVPCKMMFPVLGELKKEYGGKLKVLFIDVKKDRAAAERYGVRVIPTQIFLDSSGKELFRHVGFFPKADILKKWKELGVDMGGS